VIVIDTSVWIAAKRDTTVRTVLQALIEADEAAMPLPARLELLAGTPKKDRRAFLQSCQGVAQVVPTEATWGPLQPWVERAADVGHNFSLPDLLIAALAEEIGGLVWSLDKDFERMEQLEIVRLFAWPPLPASPPSRRRAEHQNPSRAVS
jgi:predicted nucleic acid-binding protein